MESSDLGAASVRFSDEMADLVDRYLTCELTTVSGSGVPITWPTVAYLNPASDTFTITTSIGLPVKAFNVRRNPKVAMLFSDATGSGCTSLPQVHVQGIARCPDEVVTAPEELAEYWRRVYNLQPAGHLYGSNPVLRWLFDWYYRRLVILVTPSHIWTEEPVAVCDTLTKAASPGSATGAYSEVLKRLPRYNSAIVSWLDSNGAPTSVRAALSPTDEGSVRVENPASDIRPGPASILCHSHDTKLWNQRSFVATGHLNNAGYHWTFSPERFVPGMSRNPVEMIKFLRGARSRAKNYLAQRGLPRPTVPWTAYRQLQT